MELGEKLLQARLAAGLSQRQLCGDQITRNMLSQIEHGTARPSMATLQYLASRLGKSVGYFLEEETVSENQTLMAHARRAYRAGEWAEARLVLEGYQSTDDTFALEYRFLSVMTALHAAGDAITRRKEIYARQILEQLRCGEDFPGLERRRLLLLGRISDSGLPEICKELPELEEELYLRARAALEEKNWNRGIALLEAMKSQEEPGWHLLRGQLLLGLENYAGAAESLVKAEPFFPQAIPMLERCYRELGDYKQAYLYACMQR